MEKVEWCSVVEFAEVNDRGLGIISLNGQNLEAMARYRAIIREFGSGDIIYETYPTATLLKKHAVTVYLHDGHYLRNEQIGPIFARKNPDLVGKFTIASIKELKPKVGDGRDMSTMPPRVVTINGSPEFLDSLAKFPKNYRFKLGYKMVFLNGGLRKDSSESSKAEASGAPELPAAQITDILKSHQELIVAAARRQEAEREGRV
jgi:hypothetical protein